MKAVVKVWSDEDEVSEIDAPERYDLVRIVTDYVRREFDSGWSDHFEVKAQGPNEPNPVTFAVRVEQVLDISVRASK